MVSKPPTRWTVALLLRLRAALAAFVAFVLAAAVQQPAIARSKPIKILVVTSVSERASSTMSPELWGKLIADYVGGESIAFTGTGDPTVDDCRAAGADYILVAPFDLRPRLPGLPNAAGRVAAATHISVTNCITGSTVVNQSVNFDSDPPSKDNEGDFDSVPAVTWGHAIPATLAKLPLAFARVARVIAVTPPLALVDIRAGALQPGDGLRDFAGPDHRMRAEPIVMTVTQVYDKYCEVMFAGSGEHPTVGDLVEPLARPGAPAPAPLPRAAAPAAATPKPARPGRHG